MYKIPLSKDTYARYEVNPTYRDSFDQKGMSIVGTPEDGKLIEMIEVKKHPWFLGCQFHPEFTSNPRDGHPILMFLLFQVHKTKNETN